MSQEASPAPSPTRSASRTRELVWIGLSIGAVLLTPVALHEVFRWDHARRYEGLCGPHATDIPARPCSYEQYMAEFGAGFAGVGLLLVEAGAFVLAAVLVSAAWMLAGWMRRRRNAA